MVSLFGSKWLAPAAGLFHLAHMLRRTRYAWHPGSSERLSVPTIGVGNLSVGGTGKTSMVSHLVSRLERSGMNVGVLSRGYGRRRARSEPIVVSRGEGIEVGWEVSGDEPYLMAIKHPEVVVVVGRKRAAAGRYAVEEFGADLLILDDAFQHWQVRCDLDILMVDGSRPPERDHLLPWGRLREPPGEARRAHLLVRLQQAGDQEVPGMDGSGGPPMVMARHRAVAFRDWPMGDRREVGEFAGIAAYLFSAIGNPDAFEATVTSLGIEIRGHRRFRDHHRFREEEIASTIRTAGESGAEIMITTEKDGVRLSGELSTRIPLWIMETELEILSGEWLLEEALQGIVSRGAGRE